MSHKTELVTPEGVAFADYVNGSACNPYAYETEDHKRYAAAYEALEMEGMERRVVL